MRFNEIITELNWRQDNIGRTAVGNLAAKMRDTGLSKLGNQKATGRLAVQQMAGKLMDAWLRYEGAMGGRVLPTAENVYKFLKSRVSRMLPEPGGDAALRAATGFNGMEPPDPNPPTPPEPDDGEGEPATLDRDEWEREHPNNGYTPGQTQQAQTKQTQPPAGAQNGLDYNEWQQENPGKTWQNPNKPWQNQKAQPQPQAGGQNGLDYNEWQQENPGKTWQNPNKPYYNKGAAANPARPQAGDQNRLDYSEWQQENPNKYYAGKPARKATPQPTYNDNSNDLNYDEWKQENANRYGSAAGRTTESATRRLREAVELKRSELNKIFMTVAQDIVSAHVQNNHLPINEPTLNSGQADGGEGQKSTWRKQEARPDDSFSSRMNERVNVALFQKQAANSVSPQMRKKQVEPIAKCIESLGKHATLKMVIQALDKDAQSLSPKFSGITLANMASDVKMALVKATQPT